jgi:hypothetical protein
MITTNYAHVVFQKDKEQENVNSVTILEVDT